MSFNDVILEVYLWAWRLIILLIAGWVVLRVPGFIRYVKSGLDGDIDRTNRAAKDLLVTCRRHWDAEGEVILKFKNGTIKTLKRM